MSFALELARRACALSFQALPPEAVRWAKIALLDYVGVTLAGSREPAARLALEALGALAPGPAVLFGARGRAGALDAAFVNGTAAHALDYDDCNNTFGGHPSAPILPALFALADETGAGGRDFIAAYVAGFEVETKIALAVHFHHYTKGWHPTATLGVFGAACACARLLGLDEERTATALAIAASLASGVKANFGTMTKPLHVGHCSRNGLLAARLAGAGFEARLDAFEHKQGFFEVYNGAGTYDAERALRRWADPLDIVSPGIAIKQYPCCGSTHPALDAALAIARSHDLEPEAIERIEAWIHRRRLEHTDRPAPRSDLEAKFSLQYCLARAFADRRIALEHFEGGAFRDPRVQRLLPRVRVAAYTSAQFPEDNHFGAEVRVRTGDGRTFSARVEEPLGRTARNPLPEPLLREKFDDCAKRALAPADAARVHALLQEFEQLRDVRELTDAIAANARAHAAAA
jgi:2-methylcitrate dehydratase PrpD